MKQAVLYSKKSCSLKYKNIGDYIQTLAAEQYCENPDYVNLRELSEYIPAEKTKLIANGWFTSRPESWIPTENIIPLFVSFHITPDCYEEMLDDKGIAYLKKWEPIGCRDMNTVEKLKSVGIDAWFSGCLTLTLKRCYQSEKRTDEIYFVDPYYPFFRNIHNKKTILPIVVLPQILFHYKTIQKIARKIRYRANLPQQLKRVESLLRAACFYRLYKSRFSDKCLESANYECHNIFVPGDDNCNKQLSVARKLLQKYVTAKLVVTSRIHCALPCLGFDTPVIFTTVQNESHSSGRFNGLLNFFRVFTITNNSIVVNDKELQSIGKINNEIGFSNKTNHIEYGEKLIQICESFIKA